MGVQGVVSWKLVSALFKQLLPAVACVCAISNLNLTIINHVEG